MTSKEIRAAMEGIDSEESEALAAAVWELYEALYGSMSPESERQRAAVDVLNRYRAAMEGGSDE